MARTYEVHQGRNFRPSGPRHSISDGRGGTITAFEGIPNPTADAKGNVIFFFHGTKFLGWDSVYESIDIGDFYRDGDRLAVKYEVYRADDPLCCPSGGAVTVHYSWAGHRIVQGRKIPKGARGDRIRLS